MHVSHDGLELTNQASLVESDCDSADHVEISGESDFVPATSSGELFPDDSSDDGFSFDGDSFTGTGIDDSMISGFDDSFGSDDGFTFDSDF